MWAPKCHDNSCTLLTQRRLISTSPKNTDTEKKAENYKQRSSWNGSTVLVRENPPKLIPGGLVPMMANIGYIHERCFFSAGRNKENSRQMASDISALQESENIPSNAEAGKSCKDSTSGVLQTEVGREQFKKQKQSKLAQEEQKKNQQMQDNGKEERRILAVSHARKRLSSMMSYQVRIKDKDKDKASSVPSELEQGRRMMNMYINRSNCSWVNQQQWVQPTIIKPKEEIGFLSSSASINPGIELIREGKLAYWFICSEDCVKPNTVSSATQSTSNTFLDIWTTDPYKLIHEHRRGLLHDGLCIKGHNIQSRVMSQLAIAVEEVGGEIQSMTTLHISSHHP
jgi:hypothetical protein